MKVAIKGYGEFSPKRIEKLFAENKEAKFKHIGVRDRINNWITHTNKTEKLNDAWKEFRESEANQIPGLSENLQKLLRFNKIHKSIDVANSTDKLEIVRQTDTSGKSIIEFRIGDKICLRQELNEAEKKVFDKLKIHPDNKSINLTILSNVQIFCAIAEVYRGYNEYTIAAVAYNKAAGQYEKYGKQCKDEALQLFKNNELLEKDTQLYQEIVAKNIEMKTRAAVMRAQSLAMYEKVEGKDTNTIKEIGEITKIMHEQGDCDTITMLVSKIEKIEQEAIQLKKEAQQFKIEAHELEKKAHELAKAEQFEAAKKMFSDASKTFSDASKKSSLACKKFSEAAAQYKEVGHLTHAAKLYVETEDYTNALTIYLELKQHQSAGDLYAKLSNPQMAVKKYEDVVSNLLEHPESKIKLTNPQIVCLHRKEAEQLKKVAEIYSNDGKNTEAANMNKKVADIYRKLVLDYKLAAEHYEEAAKLYTLSQQAFEAAEMLEQSGYMYKLIGDNSKASEMFIKAAEICKIIDPKLVGDMYMLAREYKLAILMYKQCGKNTLAEKIEKKQLGLLAAEYKTAAEFINAKQEAMKKLNIKLPASGGKFSDEEYNSLEIARKTIQNRNLILAAEVCMENKDFKSAAKHYEALGFYNIAMYLAYAINDEEYADKLYFLQEPNETTEEMINQRMLRDMDICLEIYIRCGRLDVVEKIFFKHDNTFDVKNLVILAESSRLRGNYAVAAIIFEHAKLYSLAAQNYYLLNNPEKAAEMFEKEALRLKDKNPEEAKQMTGNAGKMYELAQNWAKALENYKLAENKTKALQMQVNIERAAAMKEKIIDEEQPPAQHLPLTVSVAPTVKVAISSVNINPLPAITKLKDNSAVGVATGTNDMNGDAVDPATNSETAANKQSSTEELD